MGMSAVEVLEWLRQGCYDDRFANILDNSAIGDINYLLDNLDTQEIVDRIDKYEVEKYHIADADKKVWREFNVGDWVYHRKFGLGKITDVYTNSVTAYSVRYGGNRAWDKERLEHAEPPKEEKKIDKTSDVYRFAEWCYVNGINFGFMSTAENPTPKRLQEIVGRYESEKR